MSSRYKVEYRLYKDMGAANPGIYVLWDGNGQQIGDATVKPGLNKVGSFDFSIYPAHEHYGKMVPRLGFCTVWDMAYTPAKLVFNGQIRSTETDLYGARNVHCEGDLGLLNDWRITKTVLNQIPSAEEVGIYYPGATAEQVFRLIFGESQNLTTYTTDVLTTYHDPIGIMGGIEISEELYMALFRKQYSKGVTFAKTTAKNTHARTITAPGSVIVPTIGTCDFPAGMEPIALDEGTALDAIKTFLQKWPGRLTVTYPVDLWHPVIAYTQQAAIEADPHICSQAIAEGYNILEATTSIEPEEPLVTYITPVFRAWYPSVNNLRDNGNANAWRQPGTPMQDPVLAGEYGTRNGSPHEIEVQMDYDKARVFFQGLGVYTTNTSLFPTAYDEWYPVNDLQHPVTFNDVVTYHMAALIAELQAWMADHSASDLFVSMEEYNPSTTDGTVYDLRVLDRSLIDPEIESFEVGDYGTYGGHSLLITAKTLDLFHPEKNQVDLNNRKDSLTEYLGKVA